MKTHVCLLHDGVVDERQMHVLAILFVKEERVVAELAVLFPRVLQPFYEAVLVAVADGAGALARMVERRIWLWPATADAARVIFVHGERASERPSVCGEQAERATTSYAEHEPSGVE